MVIFISKNIFSFYKFTNVLIFIQDLMIDITNNNVLKKLDNISDLIQEINLEHQDEFRNISEGFAILFTYIQFIQIVAMTQMVENVTNMQNLLQESIGNMTNYLEDLSKKVS